MNGLLNMMKNKRTPYRLTDWYIYAMLLLFPLFTGFHGYSQITASKFAFFAGATGLWLLLLMISGLAQKSHVRLSALRPAVLCVLIYFLFCCISAGASPYGLSVFVGDGRFDGLITIFLCVFILLGVSRFGAPRTAYVYAFAAAASINCVIAVLQLIGFNPLFLFPGSLDYYDAGTGFSSVFLGTIGNADLFSALLCLALPLSAVSYITSQKRPFALLPAAALMAFCLFACGVSGGVLAFAVCVLCAAPFVITGGGQLKRAFEAALFVCLGVFFAVSLSFRQLENVVTVRFHFSLASAALIAGFALLLALRLALSGKHFSPKALRSALGALSLLSVFAVAAVVYFWRGTSGTLYEFSQLMHGKLQDSFGSSRILIWKKVLALFPDRPLLGGGPGTLPERLELNFSRYIAETGKTMRTYVDNAHNDYLGILINTGLLSLLAYLAAQALSLLAAAKKAAKTPLCAAFACALLCYWIQAFFGLGLFLVSPLMWLMWGLILSAPHKRVPADVSEAEPQVPADTPAPAPAGAKEEPAGASLARPE